MEKYTVSTLCTEEEYWWLEVVTNEPYMYLFGPFDTTEEVQCKSGEFFADLALEGWQIASTKMIQAGPMIFPQNIDEQFNT